MDNGVHKYVSTIALIVVTINPINREFQLIASNIVLQKTYLIRMYG